MCESLFLALKREFKRLDLLARVNRAIDSQFELMLVIVQALKAVTARRLENVLNMFFA
jgi:hypothetical protein